MANQPTTFDLALLLTDGDPTTYRGGSSTSTTVDFRRVVEAVFSANTLKAKGTPVLGVGVGMTSNSYLNLRAVSGDGDYYLASDWDKLETELKSIASKSCGGTISIQKQAVNAAGNVVDPNPDYTNGIDFGLSATNGAHLDNSSVTTGVLSGQNGWAQTEYTLPDGVTSTAITVTEPADDSRFSFESASCTVNGTPTNGSNGKVTFTATGDAIISCTFKNRFNPQLKVDKRWEVTIGNNPKQTYDAATLPVGALGTGSAAISATLTLSPPPPAALNGGTSVVPAFGARYYYNAGQGAVTVGETGVATGLPTNCHAALPEFSSLSGASINSSTGVTGTLAEGVLNSYRVTNKITCTQSAKLTLVKVVQNQHGGTLAPNAWNGGLFAKRGTDAQLVFNTGETKVVELGTFVLSEAAKDGYLQQSLVCDGTGGTLNDASVTLVAGADVTCTFTNGDKPGSVTWLKVDDQSPPNLIGGSVWTIVGPGHATPGTDIADCVPTDANCDATLDKDPAAGQFKLVGLAWGDYTVTEKTPPTGHTGASSFTFTVSAANAGTVIEKGQFVNARVLGTVTWSKVDGTDDALLGGSKWTITGPGYGAPGTEFEDCVVTPCSGLDQDPDAGEFLLIGLAWGDYTLKETEAPEGYELDPAATFDFTIAADSVVHSEAVPFENARILGTVTWSKVDGTDDALLGGSKWTLTGPGHVSGTEFDDCVATPCAGLDKDPIAGQFKLEGLAWGDYTLKETEAPEGYELDPAVTFDFTISADGQTHDETVPFENARILGTVTWSKVVAGDASTHLKGSEWKIVGPDPATTELPLTDCVEDDNADCTGPDKDGRAGYFQVTGLAWGAYQLIETKAPPGYLLDQTPHPFAVGATVASAEVGEITNQLVTPPTLPLTGGISRDFYTLLGLGVMGIALLSFGIARSRTRRRFSLEG